MTRLEMYVNGCIGCIGFISTWVWTGSQAAGWTFLALAGIIGECADAITRRLDKLGKQTKDPS